MITHESYTCEWCGEVFDDAGDCENHEIRCEGQARMKEDSTFGVKFFDKDGNEILMDSYLCFPPNITAVYCSSEEASDWVARFFEFEDYYSPWSDTSEKTGLRVFDKETGDWISPTKIIDKMNFLLDKYKIAN